MDPLSIYAILSILGTVIGTMSTLGQQDKEFNQQNELLEKEQDFTREREDLAYQRSLPSTQFQNFLDAGFNPNLAAQAVLGGDGLTVSASGSPTAPNVNSAIGALQSMIGQGGQNLYDMLMNDAKLKNLNANTEKTEVETGILPRDIAIREQTASAQIRHYNAMVDQIGKANELTDQEIELAKKENMFYGRKTEAELNLKMAEWQESLARAKLMNEQAETEKHQQAELDARAILEGAQAAIQSKIGNYYESAAYAADQQARVSKYEAAQKKYDFIWSGQHGIPLSVDGQQYVTGLLNAGEYDKADKFMTTIFQSALNQEYGHNLGSRRDISLLGFTLPEGRYRSGLYSPFTRASSQFQSIPFWNPQ